MTFPLYLNTSTITYQSVGTPATGGPSSDWDSDFREPINKKRYSDAYTFLGQYNSHRSRMFNQREVTSVGDGEYSHIHILYKISDWPPSNPGIKKGDHISAIGTIEVDFLVVQVRPESPLRSVGSDALLMYVELTENTEER